nr:GntR family transcriptional regulator [uncultured Solibaculum sp.]
MPYHFDNTQPIYLQIIRLIQLNIASGRWVPGERIPAVRELAVQFGVNPNTVQRSLSELEREGLLYSERTSGRFITKDVHRIQTIRNQMAQEYILQFVKNMLELGVSPQRIVSMLEEEVAKHHEQ